MVLRVKWLCENIWSINDDIFVSQRLRLLLVASKWWCLNGLFFLLLLMMFLLLYQKLGFIYYSCLQWFSFLVTWSLMLSWIARCTCLWIVYNDTAALVVNDLVGVLAIRRHHLLGTASEARPVDLVWVVVDLFWCFNVLLWMSFGGCRLLGSGWLLQSHHFYFKFNLNLHLIAMSHTLSTQLIPAKAHTLHLTAQKHKVQGKQTSLSMLNTETFSLKYQSTVLSQHTRKPTLT